jgi:hypothetical protein
MRTSGTRRDSPDGLKSLACSYETRRTGGDSDRPLITQRSQGSGAYGLDRCLFDVFDHELTGFVRVAHSCARANHVVVQLNQSMLGTFESLRLISWWSRTAAPQRRSTRAGAVTLALEQRTLPLSTSEEFVESHDLGLVEIATVQLKRLVFFLVDAARTAQLIK